MLQRFNGCGVSREPVWLTSSEMTNQRGACGVQRGAIQQLHAAQALTLDSRCRFPHARVVAFRQDDPKFRAPRPLIDAAEKAHFANLRFKACWTAGWTSADTSPPNRATSRTRLELR